MALRVFGIVALTLVLLLVLGRTAGAQPACTSHSDMHRQLTQRFSEARVAVALTEKGALVEVYARPDGATWTIVVTLIDGQSCILMAGRDWFDAHKVAQGPGV
ncbi:MAG: hypothetical protein D6826_07495 [Alphaproteobacteria bacterium]|nr:MAG: hypothetical protein D6826_07495 [Alphaproteobacteria bacterium]